MKKRVWKRCDYTVITEQGVFSGKFSIEISLKNITIYEKIFEFIKEKIEIKGKITSVNFTLSDIK